MPTAPPQPRRRRLIRAQSMTGAVITLLVLPLFLVQCTSRASTNPPPSTTAATPVTAESSEATTTPEPTPSPSASRPAPTNNDNNGTDSGSVYYKNCAAAKAAGAAPLHAGDAGYSSHLDRDGDGVACES
jgi:hypothetical protein